MIDFAPWEKQTARPAVSMKKLVVIVPMTEARANAWIAKAKAGDAFRAVIGRADDLSGIVRGVAKGTPKKVKPSAALAAATIERAKPVIVDDATFGRVVLDRELGCFDGTIELWGTSMRVALDEPVDFAASARMFAKVGKSRAAFDKAIAKQLLDDVYDSWEEAGNAKCDGPTLIANIAPERISCSADGATVHWKAARDLFGGHGIVTSMTKTGTVDRAEMA